VDVILVAYKIPSIIGLVCTLLCLKAEGKYGVQSDTVQNYAGVLVNINQVLRFSCRITCQLQPVIQQNILKSQTKFCRFL